MKRANQPAPRATAHAPCPLPRALPADSCSEIGAQFTAEAGLLGQQPSGVVEVATLSALRGSDSVAAVRAEILAWQRALRDLQRLQQRKGQATAEEWETLFERLGPHLERMRPSVRWAPDTGAVPVWVVDTPADMLWAVLYDWATRGGRLHRCPHCDTLFTATRLRQKFCSVTCTNRASAAAWYRRRGRKQRQAKRREGRD